MPRKRITITIRESLLRQIDALQDNVSIRSRSQAFEFLLSKVLSNASLNKALILAGGGRTMLIERKPKFVQLIGKKPLLQLVIESIEKAGVRDLIVYSDSYAEEIRNSLKEMPLAVKFLSSKKPVGTVKPLFRARKFLNETFLLAYGDTLCSLNINEMVEFHRENNSIATIALTTIRNPSSYGVALLQGNHVSKFVQKPGKDIGSFLVNAGYFLFEPKIFSFLSKKDKSLERDVLPRLAEKGLLYGYPFQGLYVNVNTKKDLKSARILL